MLQMRRFNMGAVGEADCPVFDGLFDYCAGRACMCLPYVAPQCSADSWKLVCCRCTVGRQSVGRL